MSGTHTHTWWQIQETSWDPDVMQRSSDCILWVPGNHVTGWQEAKKCCCMGDFGRKQARLQVRRLTRKKLGRGSGDRQELAGVRSL